MTNITHKWLSWARELYSLAQAGLTYNKSEYDLERYRRLLEISAEIIASQSELEKKTILKSFAMQAGYATPKIDVRGAVIQDGKILLVQERSDGGWTLPGGWGDIGETPSEVARREVREESGFEVQVEKLVAVYDANRVPGTQMEFYHAYKLVFLCTITGGEARPSHETAAVDFFDLEHLPPLSNYRTSRQMLEEIFAHHADPARPAAFD
jgi:ADP-ribose pyrophosphatase YjhB (NUDIX family)